MQKSNGSKRGWVIAGVAAAFVAAGLAVTQFGQQQSPPPAPTQFNTSNIGPVQTFVPDESGRYVADNMEMPKFSPKRVTMFCYPANPLALVSGRQIQLDMASGDTRYITRAPNGGATFSPAPLALGADIRDACTQIRQEGDAAPAVNRLISKLGL